MDGKQDCRERPDHATIRRPPGAFFILKLITQRTEFCIAGKSQIVDCGVTGIFGRVDLRLEDIPRRSENPESGSDGDGPDDAFFTKEEDEDNDGEVAERGKQILCYALSGPPGAVGLERIAIDVNGKPAGNQKSQGFEGNERGIDEEQP